MMEWGFWICVVLILWAYLGYPLFLLAAARLWGRQPAHAPIEPTLSLIIPAYNEQKVIAQKIENTLALDYPRKKLEIVVASESTDDTNHIVRSYAARGVRLRAFSRQRGKSAMLAEIVPSLHGEIVVFSDANAFCQPDALRKLVRNFADSRIGCVSGRLELQPPPGLAPSDETLYWKYETRVKQLESTLFSLLGANGSLFALRKHLYAPLSETCGDDFELSLAVRLQGYAVVLEPEAVSVEEAPVNNQGEFRRRVRTSSLHSYSGFLLLREAFRRRSGWILLQLVSHKFLRWFTPPLLIGLLLSSAVLDGPPFNVALALQLAFYGLALIGLALDRPNRALPALVRIPHYLCTLQLALLVGLAKLLVSTPQPTWEPVR